MFIKGYEETVNRLKKAKDLLAEKKALYDK